MKPSAFGYIAPDSVAQVLELLAQYGADARIIAGGQTLGPMLNMRMAGPNILVDINKVRDFDPLIFDKKRLRTGALVRQRDVLEHKGVAAALPILPAALAHVGVFQTRTRGTLCGSIAHADPTAELPLVLLTLGGSIQIASKRKRRTVAASDFFLGLLTTAREPDELVLSVDWPVAHDASRFSFEEVGVRNGHIAIVACAASAMLTSSGAISELSLGLTGISDRPILLDTKKFIGAGPGLDWQTALVEHCRDSINYVEDLHASAAYRRHVAGWLVERALIKVTAPALGNTP